MPCLKPPAKKIEKQPIGKVVPKPIVQINNKEEKGKVILKQNLKQSKDELIINPKKL